MPVTVAVAAYGTAAALGFVRLKTDVDLDLLSFAGRGEARRGPFNPCVDCPYSFV